MSDTNRLKYLLNMADDMLVLGHRMSEWCSHGPILEEDIALSNIALDLTGQARHLYDLASKYDPQKRSEDDFAYRRPEREFYNCILAEYPNGNFADTMARQVLFSGFYYFLLKKLSESADADLAAFGAKALKEVTYHLRHCSEWMVRLGDGTEESHIKMQQALNDLWSYRHELFESDSETQSLIDSGWAPSPVEFRGAYEDLILSVLNRATLDVPGNDGYRATGGRKGIHSEHLGHMLSEMQYLVRTYPDAKW
jgi:ring-1,2-phenylacetyl-CoA epoxidase subunit PaaC